jgi:hypothetical protein
VAAQGELPRYAPGVSEDREERSRQAAVARQWVTLHAVAQLEASRAPLIDIARVIPGTAKQRFRRGKSPSILSEGRGWLLPGIHGWFETAKDQTDQDGIYLRTLALLDAPGLRLRSVSYRPDFECYEPGNRGSFAGNYVRLKSAIEQLLEENGYPPQAAQES